MNTLCIGVICGGFSGERAVSLRSGKNIADALRRKGYTVKVIDPAVEGLLNMGIDLAFIALHGPVGEDGTVQALLDHLGIPYTGSGVSASVIGMNKLISKWAFVHHGIPTAAFQVISPDVPSTLQLPLPVVVKPASEGSSLGVAFVTTAAEFDEAAKRITSKYGVSLVEEQIRGVEITVSVVEQSAELIALPVLELRAHNEFYDYDAKYTEGKTTFVLPAELSPEMTKTVQDLGIKVHRALGCRGMSRTDMIVDPVRGPIVLEINTIPGMTDLSDLPAQARCGGIEFDDLVEGIVKSALQRQA
ncbi:D-alanine--D-alanine ligase [bacterium]|nr:D-alanine--D-alanine ligase [bacterium]